VGFRWALTLGAVVASLAACEAIVGITDKTTPPSPCPQHGNALFCDDFDSVMHVGDTWGWAYTQEGGTLALDTADFFTPPRSAQAVVPTNGLAQAQLGKHLGTIAGGFHLSFDLRVDVDDLSGIGQVGVAQILCPTPGTQLDYVLGPGKRAQLQAYMGMQMTPVDLPLPPLHAWTHLEMVYDPMAGVSLLMDGKTAGASQTVVFGNAGETTIILGGVFVNVLGGTTTPLKVEIDDVLMLAP
jgi:hypothetical protein